MSKKQKILLFVAAIFLASGVLVFFQKQFPEEFGKFFGLQRKFKLPQGYEHGREIPEGIPEAYLYDRAKISEVMFGERSAPPKSGLIYRAVILVISEKQEVLEAYYQKLYWDEKWERQDPSTEEMQSLPAGSQRFRGSREGSILVVDLTPIEAEKTQLTIRYETSANE